MLLDVRDGTCRHTNSMTALFERHVNSQVCKVFEELSETNCLDIPGKLWIPASTNMSY
jgi:hypothetical protein